MPTISVPGLFNRSGFAAVLPAVAPPTATDTAASTPASAARPAHLVRLRTTSLPPPLVFTPTALPLCPARRGLEPQHHRLEALSTTTRDSSCHASRRRGREELLDRPEQEI